MDLEKICQEYVEGNSTSDAPRILAESIHKGSSGLLELVKALGVYLTSSSVESRCSGMKLLSSVIIQLNAHSHKLPLEDVEYLIVFHCDRLKDRVIIIPHVLTGLQAMVTSYQLSTEHVVLVCRGLFKEVHNQSLSYSDRSLLFSILEHFLVNQLTAVQAIGSEFVLGYIQAMDGERDPRNLLTVFSSVRIIIHSLPIETLAEDLFEVTSCYFPIDFTPPPNDPGAVSRESLITTLRQCLTATPQFTKFCVPLLLEKLSSDILSAKLDSLFTLEAGAPVFGPTNLEPFLDPLWSAIRKEMLMSPSAEVQVVAAKALMALSSTFSTPPHVSGHSEDLIKSLIDKVMQDCGRYLKDPGSKLMRAAVNVLCAVASGSLTACTYIITSVLPILLEQHSLLKQEGLRRTLMEAILSFVKAVVCVNSQDLNGVCPLAEFKIQLLDIILASETSSVLIVSIAILKELIGIQGLLDHSQVTRCCECLRSWCVDVTDEAVREAGCLCLREVALSYPDLTKNLLVLPLLKTVTDPSQITTTTHHTLHALTALSVHSDLLSVILPALTDYLVSLLRSPFPSPYHWEVAQCTAVCLLSLVREQGDSEVCRGLLEGPHGVLVRLVCLCVSTRAHVPLSPEKDHGSIIKTIAKLIWCYSLTAPDEGLEWLLRFLVELLVCGEEVSAAGGLVLPILDHEQPPEHTQLVCFITALVSAARSKKVSVCCADVLVPVLVTVSCHCPHSLTTHLSAQACAAILNKLDEGPSLTAALDKLPLISDCISSSSKDPANEEQALRALRLWIWLTKAMVTRSAKSGQEMVLKLLDWCGHDLEALRREAADGFKLLLEDTETLLNNNCHANVRLFYKQQLFNIVVPHILEQFKIAETDKQQYLLQCLSHFMQGVPRQVLHTELPNLLPLLLKSLASSETGLKVSTLHALFSLIQDTPLSVVDHIPTLVPRLLALAQDKTSMVIRQAALKCVGALTTLPTHTVYPYQGTVVRELAHCLGDHKRLVRKDAVSARSKWFMLGT